MINKSIFIPLLIITLSCLSVRASEMHHSRNNEISSDPIGFLSGYLPVSFRTGLSNNVALGLHAEAKFFGFHQRTQGFGGGLGASAKIFMTSDVFQDGWYVEPTLMVHYIALRFSDTKFWNISPSAVGGYSWVWDNGFSLSLGLGLQYSYAFVDRAIFGEGLNWDLHGFGPTADLCLGYVW